MLLNQTTRLKKNKITEDLFRCPLIYKKIYKPHLKQSIGIIFTLRLTLRFLEGLWGIANLKGNKFLWGVIQKSFTVQVSKIIHIIPIRGFIGSSKIISLGKARKDDRKLFCSCNNHHTFGVEMNSSAFVWWKSAWKPCLIFPEFDFDGTYFLHWLEYATEIFRPCTHLIHIFC